jgi:hypothetical protein
LASRRSASENWEGCSPGTAHASRRRATSIPLLVDPWGAVPMNSAVAARVTALFLPMEGDRASIWAGGHALTIAEWAQRWPQDYVEAKSRAEKSLEKIDTAIETIEREIKS